MKLRSRRSEIKAFRWSCLVIRRERSYGFPLNFEALVNSLIRETVPDDDPRPKEPKIFTAFV